MLLNQKLETLTFIYEESNIVEKKIFNHEVDNNMCKNYKELLRKTIFQDIKEEITEDKIKKLNRGYFSLLSNIFKLFIEISQMEYFQLILQDKTNNKLINKNITSKKNKLKKRLNRINLFFIN
jgi:hypothetical protein